MTSSVGMMTFPIYGKIKNDPNHQPVQYMEVSQNGGYPITGWFMMDNPKIKSMMTGGTPISGNLHIQLGGSLRICELHG